MKHCYTYVMNKALCDSAKNNKMMQSQNQCNQRINFLKYASKTLDLDQSYG